MLWFSPPQLQKVGRQGFNILHRNQAPVKLTVNTGTMVIQYTLIKWQTSEALEF